MRTRKLGKTGFDVSEIGLGCWQLGGDFGPVGEEQATAILDEAIRQNVNFWDTADVYGGGLSEERIGAYLPKTSGVRVATKLGRGNGMMPDGYTKAAVRESLEGSRKRLGVEVIDLAQLHCIPAKVLEDGEIFTWLDDLVDEGLIRFYGASVETVNEGMTCLNHPNIASLQIIFNIFRQDAAAELLPRAMAQDVGVIVRLPLASGLLSGKFGKDHQFDPTDHRNYNRDGAAFSVGETFNGIPFDKGVELVEELEEFKPDGFTMVDLALRWILDHQAVSTVIAGVTEPQQLISNVNAAEKAALSPVLSANLSDFYRNKVRKHIRSGI